MKSTWSGCINVVITLLSSEKFSKDVTLTPDQADGPVAFAVKGVLVFFQYQGNYSIRQIVGRLPLSIALL